jgi:hypothetical protein
VLINLWVLNLSFNNFIFITHQKKSFIKDLVGIICVQLTLLNANVGTNKDVIPIALKIRSFSIRNSFKFQGHFTLFHYALHKHI